MVFSKAKSIAILSFLVAGCSMIYELLIAQMIGHLTGRMVLWQCLTIGLYLGGLGLGSWRAEKIKNSAVNRYFLLYESFICILGVLSVPFICILHIFYRAFFYEPFQPSPLAPNVFALICEIVVVAIGFFSGAEIPLLAKTWEQQGFAKRSFQSTSVILAFSYFGAFAGSMTYIFILLPKYQYVTSILLTAWMNLVVATFFILISSAKRELLNYITPIIAGFFLILGTTFNQSIYSLSLQNYYYGMQLLDRNYLYLLWNQVSKSPEIEQITTPLQTVDIVIDTPPLKVSKLKRTSNMPPFPPYALYLDQHLQYQSYNEYVYHETMAHIPIEMAGSVPENILILGGGDGLLVRELLKYTKVKSITLIEMDPVILKLAKESDLFLPLNEDSLRNPRVSVIQGDAFHFVRNSESHYDAIFADFPWPFQYDLAKLYSIEFYRQIERILKPDGFCVLDFPIVKSVKSSLDFVEIMTNTLKEARFQTILPMDLNQESFIFLQKSKFGIDFKFRDFGLNYKIPIRENLADLAIHNLEIFTTNKSKSAQINSIFKPVILNVRDPRF